MVCQIHQWFNMTRFVFKRKSDSPFGCGYVPNLPGLRVLDNVLNKALLVETDEDTLRRYESELRGWTVSPETTYSRPIVRGR
jgi:hypothetical protein